MKKIILTTLLMAAFAPAVLALTYDEAKTQDKPMVVMFKMNGCGACKSYEPTFDKISSKFGEKFNFVKENISTSTTKLADKLNISSVPSVFILEEKKNKKQSISYDCLTTNGCFEKKLNNY